MDTRLGQVRGLVGAYLGLSVLTLVAIVLLRNHSDVVTDAVWVRGTIVVGTAVLMTIFAARGSVRRVRIMAAVMVVAIAVIVALPGAFPIWMRIEQGVCGLLLIGVVVLTSRRSR
jgi:hypothetical protein